MTWSRSHCYSVAKSEATLGLCLVFSALCHLCIRLTKNQGYFPFFSPAPFIAIHSTIHLLKLGSPPPHKEARQRRKELRKKLLAEQEELERQMKELQAANENKQQELEAVRKVGAGAGPGRALHVIAGATVLTSELWFYQDQVTVILGRFFGELCSQGVYLDR